MTKATPLVNELYRRLRELWIADFEAILRRIHPGLLSGNIPSGAMPTGTMIYRGDYSAEKSYRAGDTVTDEGGTTYVAVAASVDKPVTDTTVWKPLGGANIPPPGGAWLYIVDDDGAFLQDVDGRYLYEPT